MDEIEIPHYFVCPISLEMMRDPVTVSTGITYDRESIERWMFSGGGDTINKTTKKKTTTCPVTKQALQEDLILPNHTLRRLIQAWCIANASYGIERIPTPRPPVDQTHILKLLRDAKTDPAKNLLPVLLRLKALALDSDRNKRCIEAAPGTLAFLASTSFNNNSNNNNNNNNINLATNASEEALSVLYHLQLTDDGLRQLMINYGSNNSNGDSLSLVSNLTEILRGSSSYGQSRVNYAIFLLKSIFQISDPVKLMSTRVDLFHQVVQVLTRHQMMSQQATKAALQILIDLCPWGRNRMKAVESGAVAVLVDLLLETSTSTSTSSATTISTGSDHNKVRLVEMALVVLDQLCGCAEGRAEFLGHAAGLAVVSKKMLRVSGVATERAVKILSSVARFSATPAVVQEMLQVGVVSKLCLVVQVNCSAKAREKAKQILALHSKSWSNSPCVPLHFQPSYPTSRHHL